MSNHDTSIAIHDGQALCYKDINENNIFFDPSTGDVRVIDNDNIGYPSHFTIRGTTIYMTPDLLTRYSSESLEQELDRLKTMMEQVNHERAGNKVLKDEIKRLIKAMIFNKKFPQRAQSVEPGHLFFTSQRPAALSVISLMQSWILCRIVRSTRALI